MTPHFDHLLAGTPFRGLIIQGFAGLCAYVGVPRDHWMADMDELQFPCHREVTFRGEGDGDYRPEDWYGWDYQHAGDAQVIPDDVRELLSDDVLQFLESGKRWTVAEVEQDLVDAALSLLEIMQCTVTSAQAVLEGH